MVKGFADVAKGLIYVVFTPIGWLFKAIGTACKKYPAIGVLVGILVYAFGRKLSEGVIWEWTKQWLLSQLQ